METKMELEPGWRFTELVRIRVAAEASVIKDLRLWLTDNRIYFAYESRQTECSHSGYYHPGDAQRIEAWLKAHVEQTWRG